ncbi:MAG: hypothetical protein WCX60_02565 [Anaerovoracaceae bacterium]
MRRRKLLLILLAITALTFGIITTSYGYWTDQLGLTGEASFEFHLPVVNDVEIPPEIPLEDLQPAEVQSTEQPIDTSTEQPVDTSEVSDQPEPTPVISEDQSEPTPVIIEDHPEPTLVRNEDEPEPVLLTTTEDLLESTETETEGLTTDESAELQ